MRRGKYPLGKLQAGLLVTFLLVTRFKKCMSHGYPVEVPTPTLSCGPLTARPGVTAGLTSPATLMRTNLSKKWM